MLRNYPCEFEEWDHLKIKVFKAEKKKKQIASNNIINQSVKWTLRDKGQLLLLHNHLLVLRISHKRETFLFVHTTLKPHVVAPNLPWKKADLLVNAIVDQQLCDDSSEEGGGDAQTEATPGAVERPPQAQGERGQG